MASNAAGPPLSGRTGGAGVSASTMAVSPAFRAVNALDSRGTLVVMTLAAQLGPLVLTIVAPMASAAAAVAAVPPVTAAVAPVHPEVHPQHPADHDEPHPVS